LKIIQCFFIIGSRKHTSTAFFSKSAKKVKTIPESKDSATETISFKAWFSKVQNQEIKLCRPDTNKDIKALVENTNYEVKVTESALRVQSLQVHLFIYYTKVERREP